MSKEKAVLETFTPDDLAHLDMQTKLQMLHEGLLDNYLIQLQNGTLHPRDMASAMTLLKNNDIKEKEDVTLTMHDKVLAELE